MAKPNRRNFLFKSTTTAAAAGLAPAAVLAAKTKNAPAEQPVKKVVWGQGKRPEKPLFSPVVTYGNLIFLSGIGAHFQGDIKSHTQHVLEQIEARLKEAGSSMEKVLKVNVYLNDLKDYAGMNEVFLGKFGPEPPVRTTIAAAGGIPGNSLVEIDCIACK
jgi:enamine deaminase RidA (YjgF/YER057c/UK114 family)